MVGPKDNEADLETAKVHLFWGGERVVLGRWEGIKKGHKSWVQKEGEGEEVLKGRGNNGIRKGPCPLSGSKLG